MSGTAVAGANPGVIIVPGAAGSMVRRMGGTTGTLRSSMGQAEAVAGRCEITALGGAVQTAGTDERRPWAVAEIQCDAAGVGVGAALGAAASDDRLLRCASRRGGARRAGLYALAERPAAEVRVAARPAGSTSAHPWARAAAEGVSPIGPIWDESPRVLESHGPAKASAGHGMPYSGGGGTSRDHPGG